MEWFERVVVLLYSQGCGAIGVNEDRLHLFQIWNQVARKHPINPNERYYNRASNDIKPHRCRRKPTTDFSRWGWEKDSACRPTWQPLWTTLDEASEARTTQLHCVCTNACMLRCDCNRAASDTQPYANAKTDSLTTRVGMACKMIV